MGNKHKPKAGTIIKQQQREQIEKLEQALFSEKWHRDIDHNMSKVRLWKIASIH